MSPHSNTKPTFLILQARIPALEPGRLIGRFVTHPARPLDNSAPDNPSTILSDEIVELEERNTTDVLKEITNADARVAVQGLVELGAGAHNKTTVIVRAPFTKTYRLQNHYRAFDKLEVDPVLREELDGPKGLFTRSRGKLYMIIGYRTCGADTSFNITKDGGGGVRGKVTVPLSAAFAGAPIPVGDMTIGAGAGATHSQFQGFKTPNEQIFAVEYKVITQRNILGMYSAAAQTVLAHDPMTHDWKNAMYNNDAGAAGLEGKFDDEDEPEPPSEPEAAKPDRRFELVDRPLEEADLRGEAMMLME